MIYTGWILHFMPEFLYFYYFSINFNAQVYIYHDNLYRYSKSRKTIKHICHNNNQSWVFVEITNSINLNLKIHSKKTLKNASLWYVIKNYKMRRKELFCKNMFDICMIVLLFHESATSMITSRLAVLTQRYFSLTLNLWWIIHVIQNQNSVGCPIFHQDENDGRWSLFLVVDQQCFFHNGVNCYDFFIFFR